MSQIKLSPSENSILRELIFPESFHHIQDETGLSYGAIRDDLITLINRGFIEVIAEDRVTSLSPFYDSDNIESFCFKATNSGLKLITRYAI
ncbi:MAG: hypothetical protein WD604_06875 [Balneolaceae bacterium]